MHLKEVIDMSCGITVLNFDHTYTSQSFLEGEEAEWLDLYMIPGTNLYCEHDSLRQIAEKLQTKRRKNITYIGSGNYHYVSYLLLSKIDHPFTLILFDHHTDMLPSPSESIISCGSWVLDAVTKLPHVKKVILIGVDPDWAKQVPAALREKVAVFPEPELHQDYTETVHHILQEIPTESVYISVDKDVLHPDEAVTIWDQGSLRLKQLVDIVDSLAWSKDICGFDVCGEYPLSPEEAFRKKAREAVAKNNYANHVILEHVKAV